MNKFTNLLAVSAALSAMLGACGARPDLSAPKTASEAGAFTSSPAVPASPSASISSLSWLAGTWTSSGNGMTMEAEYQQPSAGMILGMIRFTAGGQVRFFEFERLAAENGTVVLYPTPNGVPGVSFKLARLDVTSAVFTNPDHAFPRDINLAVDARGQLHMKISGTQNGQTVAQEFVMARN